MEQSCMFTSPTGRSINTYHFERHLPQSIFNTCNYFFMAEESLSSNIQNKTHDGENRYEWQLEDE